MRGQNNFHMTIQEAIQTTDCQVAYITGLRSLGPTEELFDSTNPRWETAEFEEIVLVKDRSTQVPSHWQRVEP
jgi:hypothetical protein